MLAIWHRELQSLRKARERPSVRRWDRQRGHCAVREDRTWDATGARVKPFAAEDEFHRQPGHTGGGHRPNSSAAGVCHGPAFVTVLGPKATSAQAAAFAAGVATLTA
jgi:hypothetical protein